MFARILRILKRCQIAFIFPISKNAHGGHTGARRTRGLSLHSSAPTDKSAIFRLNYVLPTHSRWWDYRGRRDKRFSSPGNMLCPISSLRGCANSQAAGNVSADFMVFPLSGRHEVPSPPQRVLILEGRVVGTADVCPRVSVLGRGRLPHHSLCDRPSRSTSL